jgi:hypothetical protein
LAAPSARLAGYPRKSPRHPRGGLWNPHSRKCHARTCPVVRNAVSVIREAVDGTLAPVNVVRESVTAIRGGVPVVREVGRIVRETGRVVREAVTVQKATVLGFRTLENADF